MFKKSEEYQEIKNELELIGILNAKAKFECFSDNMITYSHTIEKAYHEFTIICDDVLLDKMKIKELLDLKNVEYFSHKIYIDKNREAEKVYNQNDISIIKTLGLDTDQVNKIVLEWYLHEKYCPDNFYDETGMDLEEYLEKLIY